MRKLLVISALFTLISCATQTQIEYRDRDVIKNVITQVHDTIRENSRDSIFIEKETRGDTVFVTKYKEVIRWRDKVVVKVDTCYQEKAITEYKEKIVEKKRAPKWCYLCIGVCVCVAIIYIKRLLKWMLII